MFLANVSLSQPKAVPGQRNGIRITEIRSISAQNLSPLGFLAEVVYTTSAGTASTAGVKSDWAPATSNRSWAPSESFKRKAKKSAPSYRSKGTTLVHKFSHQRWWKMMKNDERWWKAQRISKAQSSKLVYDSTMPPGTTLDLGIDIHIIKDHQGPSSTQDRFTAFHCTFCWGKGRTPLWPPSKVTNFLQEEYIDSPSGCTSKKRTTMPRQWSVAKGQRNILNLLNSEGFCYQVLANDVRSWPIMLMSSREAS